MPYSRPDLQQTIDSTAGQIETRFTGVLARVRRSLAGIFARVVGGGLWQLQGYAEWLDRQKWPDLCDEEFLDWHGARWGKARTPAVQAAGSVRFTGVDASAIAAGTIVQRADGVQYATTADAAIAAGEAIVPVLAVVAGQAGNASSGVALTLTSPVAGVNAAATAYTAMTQGADLEKDEPYRARILRRIRQVPMGGAKHDYEDWALEVPGVTRVWVSPLENGPGSVVVRFVRDNDPAFIPDAAEVAAVQAYIDERRPVTAAEVTVLAPASQAVAFSIRLVPNTAAVQAAVLEELDAVFASTDNVPGGTILLSHLQEAVSVAAGETDHRLFAPAADIVLPANTMAVRGAVTWM